MGVYPVAHSPVQSGRLGEGGDDLVQDGDLLAPPSYYHYSQHYSRYNSVENFAINTFVLHLTLSSLEHMCRLILLHEQHDLHNPASSSRPARTRSTISPWMRVLVREWHARGRQAAAASAVSAVAPPAPLYTGSTLLSTLPLYSALSFSSPAAPAGPVDYPVVLSSSSVPYIYIRCPDPGYSHPAPNTVLTAEWRVVSSHVQRPQLLESSLSTDISSRLPRSDIYSTVDPIYTVVATPPPQQVTFKVCLTLARPHQLLEIHGVSASELSSLLCAVAGQLLTVHSIPSRVIGFSFYPTDF